MAAAGQIFVGGRVDSYCIVCDKELERGDNTHEMKDEHINNLLRLNHESIFLVESALANRFQTWMVKNSTRTKNVDLFLDNIETVIVEKMRHSIRELENVKVSMSVYCDYIKPISKVLTVNGDNSGIGRDVTTSTNRETAKSRIIKDDEGQETDSASEDESDNEENTTSEGERDPEETDTTSVGDSDDEEQFLDSEEEQRITFKTKNVALYQATDCLEKYSEMKNSILDEKEKLQTKGSGLILKRIVAAQLRIMKFYPVQKGGTYIPLPLDISKTRCVVNVQNTRKGDQNCFKYAILGKHLPEGQKHRYHPSAYKEQLFKKYNFDCVKYPVDLQDITNFEKINDVSVSVFGIREKGPEDRHVVRDHVIIPIRDIKEYRNDHTDLLMIADNSNMEKPRFHYCWITNFEALVRPQITNYEGKIYICRKCFQHFTKEYLLEHHRQVCYATSTDTFLACVPENPYLTFKNVKNIMRHQYVIVADFEAALPKNKLTPEECALRQTAVEIDDKANVPEYIYEKHRPLSYAYKLITNDLQLEKELNNAKHIDYQQGDFLHFYMSPPGQFDAADKFVDSIVDLARKVSGRMNNRETYPFSTEDQKQFDNTTRCQICNEDFQLKGLVKCRDHTHQYCPDGQSKYRGALCSGCNLNYSHPKSLIVYFHNGSRYDFHFICRALVDRNIHVDILPVSEETYISMKARIGEGFVIKFVDSFRLLASSLDDLVKSVKWEQMHLTRRLVMKYVHDDPSDFEFLGSIVRAKGVFPYSFVDSHESLKATQPPDLIKFYNKLSDRHITEEEHARFCDTWKLARCQNLGDYLKFYNQLDICQLTDVLNVFRDYAMSNFKLDPAHYVSLPAFGLDAFLKTSPVRIKLFTDVSMVHSILGNIRGGITQSIQKHAKANNPYLPADHFDKNKPTSYIQYLDATSLYATTMTKPLPYDGYEWVTGKNLLSIDVYLKHPDNDKIGYILDVDTHYPLSCHDTHVDLPFLCFNDVPPLKSVKQRKLMTAFKDHKNYLIHYVALKQAVSAGVVVTRVNKVLRFQQRDFMKGFIDQCAALRSNATSNFESNTAKLISNSVYGKMLENPLKRKKIQLVTSEEQLFKLMGRVEFLDCTMFDGKSLAAVHMRQTEVMFDRPMIVGFSVLDLSKTIMYEFHYNHMKRLYPGEKSRALYMDTDSLIYQIYTEDLYKDMVKHRHLYDTSNFPKDDELYSTENERKLGTFKDETKGFPILEFVSLQAKVYAVKIAGQMMSSGERGEPQVIMRAKGVSRPIVLKSLNFDSYMEVLLTGKEKNLLVPRIGSRKHHLHSIETYKTALTSFDDKRYCLPNTVFTLPWGHYNVPKKYSWETNDDHETLESEMQRTIKPLIAGRRSRKRKVELHSDEEEPTDSHTCPDFSNNVKNLIAKTWKRPNIGRINAGYLRAGVEYPLTRIERVKTKFGGSMVAVITFERELRKVFLPNHIVRDLQEDPLDRYENGDFNLKYLGRPGVSHQFQFVANRERGTVSFKDETDAMIEETVANLLHMTVKKAVRESHIETILDDVARGIIGKITANPTHLDPSKVDELRNLVEHLDRKDLVVAMEYDTCPKLGSLCLNQFPPGRLVAPQSLRRRSRIKRGGCQFIMNEMECSEDEYEDTDGNVEMTEFIDDEMIHVDEDDDDDDDDEMMGVDDDATV